MRRRQAKGAGGAARDGEASARRFGSLASACVDRPRARSCAPATARRPALPAAS
ncbi:hypothetical protein BURPS406E_0534 [Burkholderia pseudomallei 406e]|uniref:Uncharacterized protein n=1 Tax=Burkholderia mallei (strain NCTC 10229) TaxID=412022 RepID=A2RZR5_BURM9|nr:hypothetical protein BMA10229_1382 [Burkholderia mallei NCTC 10229]EDK62123.1 hypothetical protein BMAJHU_I1330 [Burkholderia mallei JHU]EDO83597.1 hypothetical protein BURPS406E_0534 [Burkholderia pseudomallei 406e]EDS82018.1 hypothetical protein BURPSS13_0247 [Burkholderia pseudomallei S13]EDU10015.1 hypothetical protein BURPS1655_J0033 [Burkholderia pseudomallei 1655]EEH24713.1 conserved hypothetical protein [Burkholderia pseudomallei Pakistan 9]EEP49738.1 conserved hypothetical protein